MGPPELPDGYYSRCHHIGRLQLADLPDWDWHDISAHLKCTQCGSVGWVDTLTSNFVTIFVTVQRGTVGRR
jgi:hypothetical protein